MKPASTTEKVLLLLTVALMWGGFVSFGQFISAQGFYAVSWKWQLVSVMIAAIIFTFSLFILLSLISAFSVSWKIYVSLKNYLERKQVILLAFSSLVIILSIFIFASHRIHELIGINLFSLMLFWLFTLPVFLFISSLIRRHEPLKNQTIVNQGIKYPGFLLSIEKVFKPLGKWNFIWMGLLFTVYMYSFFAPWGLSSLPTWLTLLFYVLLALVFNLGMHAIFPTKSWKFGFIASLLFLSAGAILVSNFTRVNNDPFSLTWSEGTWLFDASLIFSKLIYGVHLNPPLYQTNRAILQSIPFLLYPAAPLWLHRLWEAILWCVLPLTFGLLFSKRLELSGILSFVFIGWTFLFLQQGPVYYFLFLSPILILLIGKSPRFWVATFVVVVASIWNGIERVNWFPMPGCLMALFYLLETPYKGRFWDYWWKPLVWIVGGILVAFSARYGLWLISGYPGSYFLSSVTAGLLTYRLLPNSTNPLGILSMIILAVLPIMALLITFFKLSQTKIHWSRRWAQYAIILVFFLGGVVVSIKIGGGNNLHNLDAFLLLVGIISSMFFFKKVIPDSPKERISLPIPAWSFGLILFLPILFSFNITPPLVYSKTETQSALNEINQRIKPLPSDSLPVLFISQNQLLATGMVKNVIPIPAYEMSMMMEMALAKNQDYLRKLYSDLSNQRYSLIISPELSTLQKGPEWDFGEENDVWNNTISIPVLRYYHPIYTQEGIGIQILVPNNTLGQ